MPRATTTDPPRQPTTTGRLPAKLLAFAARQQLDAAALRDVSGLPPLVDSEMRVPLTGVYALCEAIAAALGEGAAWRFAAVFEAADFDALGFLMLTSATIGESLERFVACQRLYDEGDRFTLTRAGDEVVVQFHPWGPRRPAHDFMAEFSLLDLLVNGGALLGRDLEARAVRLRRPAPVDPEPLRAALGGHVEFAALCDEVVLPTAILALPMPQADPGMCAFFERHTQGQLARLAPEDMSLRSRVRALVERRLHLGPPDLTEAAAALGLAPRTLQRRLQAEGESLQSLVEAVRRERAAALLTTSMPLAEVSYLLGYAEPSVFFRAFRRWSGETPERYRMRVRGDGRS